MTVPQLTRALIKRLRHTAEIMELCGGHGQEFTSPAFLAIQMAQRLEERLNKDEKIVIDHVREKQIKEIKDFINAGSFTKTKDANFRFDDILLEDPTSVTAEQLLKSPNLDKMLHWANNFYTAYIAMKTKTTLTEEKRKQFWEFVNKGMDQEHIDRNALYKIIEG